MTAEQLSIVELRVHGVSGTPPESTLDDPYPEQVGGDDSARFFRRTRPVKYGCARVIEAFHWGRLTSGSPTNALWLVLAPFGLVNLARYTLPMKVERDASTAGWRETGRPVRWIADAVLRLIGLALTLLLLANIAFVAVDLVGWQCAGSAICADSNGWLPFADNGSTPYGLRLLVALLAPSALLALLWRFGRQVHLYPPARMPGQTETPMRWSNGVGSLDAPWFWYASPLAPVLRALHTTAATTFLAILIGYSTTNTGLAGGPLLAWLRGIAIAMLAVAVYLVIRGWVPRNPKPDPTGTDAIALPWWLAWWRRVAVLLLAGVTAVAVIADWDRRTEQPGNLPGFEIAFNSLYLTIAVLLLVFFGLTAGLLAWTQPAPSPKIAKPYRPMFLGLAAPVITSVAILLATGLTAGTAIQVARLVGTPAPADCPPQDCTDLPIVVPDVHRVTVLVWGVLGGVVALIGLGFVLFKGSSAFLHWFTGPRKQADPLVDRITADYPKKDLDPRTAAKIAGAWRQAALKFKIPYIVGALAAVGVLAAAAQAALVLQIFVDSHRDVETGRFELFELNGEPAWRLSELSWLHGRVFGVLDDVGAWTVTGVVAGLIFLGSRAFRSEGMRRGVGVVWDLLAFWPRLAHPLVPPPYGGRAVLELARRATEYGQRESVRHVVLSGHSQGSLIVAATTWYLVQNSTHDPDARDVGDATAEAARATSRKLRLITYGSQLMWAYPRLFPAFIGHQRLVDIFGAVDGRWYNLHRWTDPLGAPVLAHRLSGAPNGGPPPDPVSNPWQALTGEEVAGTCHATSESWYRMIGHEVQMRDPEWITPPRPLDNPRAPLLGHSDYYRDHAYEAVIDLLVAEPEPPATAAAGEPDPLRRKRVRALRPLRALRVRGSRRLRALRLTARRVAGRFRRR